MIEVITQCKCKCKCAFFLACYVSVAPSRQALVHKPVVLVLVDEDASWSGAAWQPDQVTDKWEVGDAMEAADAKP